MKGSVYCVNITDTNNALEVRLLVWKLFDFLYICVIKIILHAVNV